MLTMPSHPSLYYRIPHAASGSRSEGIGPLAEHAVSHSSALGIADEIMNAMIWLASNAIPVTIAAGATWLIVVAVRKYRRKRYR